MKAQIRREGRVKLSEVPAREITAMAEARLLEDVEYRAKLIAEAKAVVERWQWGPRGGQFAKACGARRSIERMSCTEWSGEMIVGYSSVSTDGQTLDAQQRRSGTPSR